MPGVTPQQAQKFTDYEHGQLNMVFQFDHVVLDHDGDKWKPRTVTVNDLRDTLAGWQMALAHHGWNSLYWSNHDQPRVVSRYGNDTAYWYESATALATVLHLHRGTPYVYQGEELGMTNVPFDTIEDFRDIESLNYFRNATTVAGLDPSAVLATLRQKSRDNARTPMQWTSEAGAGFSSGTPWIPVNPNHVWLNAAAQTADPRSVYHYYRRLIALRRTDPVLTDGDFALLDATPETVYAFRRTLGEQRIEVYANLSNVEVSLKCAAPDRDRILLGNYPAEDADPVRLAPWEVRTFRC
jgi:oligo-1,6-glucosidase